MKEFSPSRNAFLDTVPMDDLEHESNATQLSKFCSDVSFAASTEEVVSLIEHYQGATLSNGKQVDVAQIRGAIANALQEGRGLRLDEMSFCDIKDAPGVWNKLTELVAGAVIAREHPSQIEGEKRDVLRPTSFGSKIAGFFKRKDEPAIAQEKQAAPETPPKSHVLRSPFQKAFNGAGRLIKGTAAKITSTLDAWQKRTEEEHRITMISDPVERSRAFSEFYNGTSSQTKAPTQEKTDEQPQTRPETIRTPDVLNYEAKLQKVDQNTKKFSERVKETLQPFGKKLLTYLEKGKGLFSGINKEKIFNALENTATNLDKEVGTKTKLFASAGLITAGAFAGFAAPAVITAIAAASVGMRIVSAAGTYKLLNNKYKEWENNNKNASSLKKTTLKSGAVLGAAFMGQAAGLAVEGLGELFERISPSELYENSIKAIKDMLPVSYEPTEGLGDPIPPGNHGTLDSVITNDLFGIHNVPQPEIAPVHVEPPHSAVVDSVILTAPEHVTQPALEVAPIQPSPEMVYEITKGDSLWSALRKTLSVVNFENFSQLSSGAQEAKIRALIDEIAKDPTTYGIKSGNINLIRPGDVLDFTKVMKH